MSETTMSKQEALVYIAKIAQVSKKYDRVSVRFRQVGFETTTAFEVQKGKFSYRGETLSQEEMVNVLTTQASNTTQFDTKQIWFATKTGLNCVAWY